MPGPARSFLPAEGRRTPWFAIVASLGVHLLLLLIKVGGAWLPPPPRPGERILLVPLGTEGPRAVEMAFREPSGGGAPHRPKTAGISELPTPETGPIPDRPRPPDTVAVTLHPSDDTTSGPVGPRKGPENGRVGPAQGDGKLWVRPLPLPPRDLARAVARTQAELVDSAVTAIVQAYIDSVLTVAPPNELLPKWSTKVGGQNLGLDAQWIYLGPIKVPTALVAGILNALGALPGGQSAEMSDYTRYRALQQMREDVQIAARRAQTMDDFKRAIRELRAQREREREFIKNQKTPPKKADSTADKTP